MASKPPKVSRVVISIQVNQGKDRNFPMDEIKIPEWQVGAIYELLAEAQKVRPAATVEDIVRAVWRSGVTAVQRLTLAKAPVRGISGHEAKKLGLEIVP